MLARVTFSNGHLVMRHAPPMPQPQWNQNKQAAQATIPRTHCYLVSLVIPMKTAHVRFDTEFLKKEEERKKGKEVWIYIFAF